jgi:hypothetical protein
MFEVMNESDTPRTDAESKEGWSGDAVCVSVEFAQALEREINQLKSQPTFSDALRIANGCRQDADNASDHWRLGINSVITALERASKRGLNDPQVAALWKMGGEK